MIERVVRCPYCVLDDEFRRMIVTVDGSRFMCNKCGYMARPYELDFKCFCPKCVELNHPKKRFSLAS